MDLMAVVQSYDAVLTHQCRHIIVVTMATMHGQHSPVAARLGRPIVRETQVTTQVILPCRFIRLFRPAGTDQVITAPTAFGH